MSLLKNPNDALRFIEKVLKPLQDDEVYISLLCARKKYCSEISSSEEVLMRDIIRNNDKDKILRKLRKMSIVEDIYTAKDNIIIPSEALALYVLLDPRSTLKAYGEFNKQINDWLTAGLRGEHNIELYRRIDLKLFSAIHKSRSRPIYFIIDIDKKDEELLNETRLSEDISPYIIWISETHGGYHIILERNNITGSYIHYLQLQRNPNIEILREPMTPLPGAMQGGFLVKEYEKVL